jgi:hypothetical protein
MKRLNMKWLTPLLVLALVLSGVGVLAAQAEDPPEACTGDAVAGTVVAYDEATNTVTVQLEDDSLCTVQLSDGTYDHPITSLLGTYFDQVSAESLQAALDALTVPYSCTDTTDPTTCDKDETGVTNGQVISVEGPSGGPYLVTVEYTDENGDPQTFSFFTSDPEEAQAYMDALDGLMVDWQLQYDGEGNPFVSDAGDQVAALHDDGMGFGVIVKLLSMASDAAEACTAAEGETLDPEALDPCTVDLQTLVDEFKSGTGLGLMFQEYGKPSFLGIGHVKQALRDNGNQPSDNACGYWRKHPEQAPASCLPAESSSQNNGHGGGKPPWAGQPGGPKSQD